jgi:hypothetical protein
MNHGPEPIISLPNFRVGLFEILVSLGQLGHKEHLLYVHENDLAALLHAFYARGQPASSPRSSVLRGFRVE